MPYYSKKQEAWANATHQPFAHEWNEETKRKGFRKKKRKTKRRKATRRR